jgi:hypothetical protein
MLAASLSDLLVGYALIFRVATQGVEADAAFSQTPFFDDQDNSVYAGIGERDSALLKRRLLVIPDF